jgi:periplasmic copper chaperone A
MAFSFPRAVRTTVMLGALLLAPIAASAHDFTLGALTLDHPWARATAGPVRTGAAFLAIENAGAADRLVSAAGDIAERVELHTHRMEGDVMQMRPVEAVAIPAQGAAVLQPGGTHIMLIGLKQPLREGERFPLTLTFEKAGATTVEFAVEGVASMGPHGGTHDSMGHGSMDHDAMGHEAPAPAD